ncbi:hypothetical protein D3C72_1229480 [compost metagenome]
MDMHMNGRVEFFGNHPDLLQVFVAHGVRRMWAHGHGNARVMTQVAEQFDCQVQAFFGAAGTRDREIQ